MSIPPDTNCMPDIQSGYEYQFIVESGGSHGTLTGGGIGSSGASFKRTSAGDVVIDLRAYNESSGDNCKPGASFVYGSATLN